MDSYIIRNETGGCRAIYYRDGNIYFRERTDDTWTFPETIGTEAKPDFTIALSRENMAVYQSLRGGICIGAPGHKPRTLIKSGESRRLEIYYINHGGYSRLIYNSPGDISDLITEQHISEDKTWSSGIAIDSYIPSSARLIDMGNGNCIMLYIKKVPEYQLGYREISPASTGRFKMLYASGYRISDYSAAVTEEAVHVCLIISGRRANRVLYIRKDSAGISVPLSLWEGPADFCVTGIIQNKLCIWWKTPVGVFKAISYNMGMGFKKAERCNELADCRKAGFINMTNDPDSMVFSDMIVRRDKVYESMLL